MSHHGFALACLATVVVTVSVASAAPPSGPRVSLSITDVAATEVVRQYVLDQFAEAVEAVRNGQGDKQAVDGWRQMLSAGRMRSVGRKFGRWLDVVLMERLLQT